MTNSFDLAVYIVSETGRNDNNKSPLSIGVEVGRKLHMGSAEIEELLMEIQVIEAGGVDVEWAKEARDSLKNLSEFKEIENIVSR